MIEHELIKKQFVGRDGFVWWIGQIVKADTWKTNLPAYRADATESYNGFGERYRVRIMGYHTADSEALPDNDLPWASVMYPVTAGSGGATSSESTQLRQGTFVYGFFLDGEDGQMPVIMGVIAYNSYTAISRNVPRVPFVPFDGYEKLDKRAQYALKESKNKEAGTQTKQPGIQKQDPQQTIKGSVEAQNNNTESSQEESQRKEGTIPTHQSKLRSQGANQVKGIATDIKNLIAKVELITRDISKFGSEQKALLNTYQEKIQKALDEAMKFVSGKVKWIVKELRKNVVERANGIAKDLTFLFMPNERPKVKTARDKVLFGLSCIFNKAISGIGKLVGDFLKNAATKIVNVTECLLENFVGGFLGQIIGIISGAVDAIFKPLNALANLVKGIGGISLAFDAIGEIFDTVKGILGFSFCEEKMKGPVLDQWSIWDGAGDNGGGPVSLSKILKQAKKAKQTGQNLASQFLGAAGAGVAAVNQVTGAVGDITGLVSNISFDSLFDPGSCGVGPIACGPPTVSFFGGGGTGAAANAIISQTGKVLGVDILSSGSGYTDAPFINIGDPCGKGKGAVAKVVLNNRNNGGQGSGAGLDTTPIDASRFLTGFASQLSNGQPIQLPQTQTTPTDQSVGQTGTGQQVPLAGNDAFTGTPIDIALLSPGTGYADSSNVPTIGGSGEGLTVNIITTIDANLGDVEGEIGPPPEPNLDIPLVTVTEGIKLTSGGEFITAGGSEFTKPANLSKYYFNYIVNNFNVIDIDGDGCITSYDAQLLQSYAAGVTDLIGAVGSPPLGATRTTNSQLLAHLNNNNMSGTGILDITGDKLISAEDASAIQLFASSNSCESVKNIATCFLSVGGTGGVPVVAGELSVTVGGTGGIPILTGQADVPLTVANVPIKAGATGGTEVKSCAIGGRIVTAGGLKVRVGGDGEFVKAYQENQVASEYPGNETEPTTIVDGSIVSVQIFDPGEGYKVGDVLTIANGTGATFRIERVQGPNLDLLDSNSSSPGGVAKVIILDPGTGYLSAPDGDEGGDGRIWKRKDQTSVRRSNYDYDRPYNPGQNIHLNPGDEVCMPVGTSEKIFGPDGNVLENIPGGVCYKVSNPGKITAPQIPDDLESPLQFPTSSNGQYPVLLCLDEIYIKDSGFDYSPGDTIVMEPNYGAVLEPVFDGNGSLAKVNIIKSAEGFTDLPEIFIDSETGYNAELIPVFKVCRIGDDIKDEIPPGTSIISVIDCVGKF
jgi:hypothetical protein